MGSYKPRAFSPYPVRCGSAVPTDAAGREYFLHLIALSDPDGRYGFAFGADHAQYKPKVPIHKSVFVPTSATGLPAEGVISVRQPAQLTETHLAALGGMAQALEIGWCYDLDENQLLTTVEIEPAEHDIALHKDTGEPVYFMDMPSISVMLAGLRALAVQSVYAQS